MRAILKVKSSTGLCKFTDIMRLGVIWATVISVFCNLKCRSSSSTPILVHNTLQKTVVNDVSFCQHAVIEFLVKENNSGANIFDQSLPFVFHSVENLYHSSIIHKIFIYKTSIITNYLLL
jgi:hypothetical protein